MRLGQYRVFAPDRESLRTGESCDECGCQMKDAGPLDPCPLCFSTVRRLPRAKGQAVAETYDVALKDAS